VLRDFWIEGKIFSVTCDNASNNDTMIDNLDDSLTEFSSLNRTRCFAHILNLVAKALLKQFDVKTEPATDLNVDERSLLENATDIETEELTMPQEPDDDEEDAIDVDIDDDDAGWVGEIEALTPEERIDLDESIRPVKRTLVKV
jgi:hypothetical protein